MNSPYSSIRKRAGLALLLAVLTGSAHAQSINWFTMDAGGGVQSSANYVLGFTAGQADVGPTAPASANYRILPGFWALADIGPFVAQPTLSIAVNGPNVVLSWQSPSSGYVLQQTDSLDALPASWSDSLGLVNDNGIIRSVVLPRNVPKRFFRLRKP